MGLPDTGCGPSCPYEEIAVGEFGLEVYPNQIEVITSEQMLDAYSSNGLPLMYSHWSFGKRFAREMRCCTGRGYQGLAYEIVINASPCISYIMEENTATLQALVIAHACFGHNHFFRNNYLFRQWTDADAILGYLEFAKVVRRGVRGAATARRRWSVSWMPPTRCGRRASIAIPSDAGGWRGGGARARGASTPRRATIR